MRPFLGVLAIAALIGCGGGGASSSTNTGGDSSTTGGDPNPYAGNYAGSYVHESLEGSWQISGSGSSSASVSSSGVAAFHFSGLNNGFTQSGSFSGSISRQGGFDGSSPFGTSASGVVSKSASTYRITLSYTEPSNPNQRVEFTLFKQ